MFYKLKCKIFLQVIFLFLSFELASPAQAQSKNKIVHPNEIDNENIEPAIDVPKSYQEQNFKLRIGGKTYPLQESKVLVDFKDFMLKRRVEFLDYEYRVIADSRQFVDEKLLQRISSRSLKLSFSGGFAFFKKNELQKLLVSNDPLNYCDFDFLYSPSAFGFFSSISNATSKESKNKDIKILYEETKFYFGGLYQFVPFKLAKNGFAKRMHLGLRVAPYYSQNKIRASDYQEVTVKDSSKNFGYMVGSEFGFPIISNFWVNIKSTVTYEKTKFNRFDFDQGLTHLNIFGGISYAF